MIASFGGRLWHDFYPPDSSTVGPNIVASVVIGVIVALVVRFVWARFVAPHIALLHAKMDHIIKHHPDIPPFKGAATMSASMSNPDRTPGKLGAKAPVFPSALHDFSTYLTSPLPPPPVDVLPPNVSPWGMGGNDSKGDCGVIGFIHGSEAAHFITGQPLNEPPDQAVIDAYMSYSALVQQVPIDQAQDDGVVLSDFLKYVANLPNGLLGHGVDSFAPFHIADLTMFKQVIDLLDFAYLGIQVTDTMQQAFQAQQPWTAELFHAGQVLGGHCVVAIGYEPEGIIIVTWGAEQLITWDGWAAFGTEGWAVLTTALVSAHGDGRGVNLDALHADLALL